MSSPGNSVLLDTAHSLCEFWVQGGHPYRFSPPTCACVHRHTNHMHTQANHTQTHHTHHVHPHRGTPFAHTDTTHHTHTSTPCAPHTLLLTSFIHSLPNVLVRCLRCSMAGSPHSHIWPFSTKPSSPKSSPDLSAEHNVPLQFFPSICVWHSGYQFISSLEMNFSNGRTNEIN